ncbi:MAG: ATP-binding cassette domain-containing protein, partial [Anaerolineales bacterium]
GHVFYDDQDMQGVPPGDRHIGMVFQNYALYPHFRGQGNLAFYFRVRKAPDEEAEERIRVTSEMMGMGFSELLGRKPGVLSGGQQQRLAIARAIVRKPRLFLFDEPLASLDAKLRVQTRTEIRRLLRRFAITSIYVTHDQTEAISLGDLIAVMRDGKIEQVGTYDELRSQPANVFVAEFVGSPPMNLLAGGTITEGALRLGGATFSLPDAVRSRLSPDRELTIGVRPEGARLAPEGASRGMGEEEGLRLRAIVEVLEPDFARRVQLVHVRTGQLAYAAMGELDDRLSTGDEVDVLVDGSQLYYFDGDSGRLAAGPAQAAA